MKTLRAAEGVNHTQKKRSKKICARFFDILKGMHSRRATTVCVARKVSRWMVAKKA